MTAPKRPGRSYVTWSETIDVDIPLDEFLAGLTDEDLAKHGLMRVGQGKAPAEGIQTPIGEHLWAVNATRTAS